MVTYFEVICSEVIYLEEVVGKPDSVEEMANKPHGEVHA